MKILTAPADFSGWAELLGLLRGSFSYMDKRIDPPSSLASMGVAELQAKAATETLIVAYDGPQLVGCAFAARQADGVYVGKLAVDPAFRRNGIARALLEAAEGLARRWGLAQLELQTRIELTENHATFAALGFEKVAETSHPGFTRPTSVTMRKPVLPNAEPAG